MSVEAFSGLPMQVGHAVASTVGRTAMWVVAWYMQAPLRNTALAAMMSLSAMAGSNALYNQSGNHPAPMFGSFDSKTVRTEKTVTPVMPAERPAKLLITTPAAAETTGSIAQPAELPVEPIGNADVFEIQRKLTAFKLFDAKVDGLYGPRTAAAIKAFETRIGRKPLGELTPEIVEIIKSTPIIAEPAELALAPAEAAPAAVVATETVAPLVTEEEPLPAPAPLTIEETVAPAASVEPASIVAEDASGTTSLEMTSPAATAPAKRTVQTIAVRAPVAEEQPKQAADVLTMPIDVTKVASDPRVVSAIQRGLSSLGFLHGTIDGVAGEATAKAIRNFEVYYNYNVTGLITPELLNLLAQNGAVI